ncbi:MAG: DUF6144 family protein [Methanolobus sp.]|nr:DUF6144 family protein [Methanolobus sp.]
MDAWFKQLLQSLDKNLDEKTRIEIMEACGEECPFTHLTDEKLLDIRKGSEDESDFLEKLSLQWRVRIEDGKIYVVFDKCYCPFVNQNVEGASKTLCYCTRGNLKKKFRLGLGREVNVLMEKTILAGDDECRFKIMV